MGGGGSGIAGISSSGSGMTASSVETRERSVLIGSHGSDGGGWTSGIMTYGGKLTGADFPPDICNNTPENVVGYILSHTT